MKAILGLLPYGVVLVAAGGAIWWLLSRDIGAGKWLLAGVVVGHGLVHLLFFAPAPAATPDGPEWPFDVARAWPVASAGLDVNLVRAAALALIVVVIGAFGLTGLSTVGIGVPSGWWAPAAAVGSIVSAVVLVALFNPQLVLGLGIDAILLWVVVANAWRP
jgi:hypothetical protein